MLGPEALDESLAELDWLLLDDPELCEDVAGLLPALLLLPGRVVGAEEGTLAVVRVGAAWLVGAAVTLDGACDSSTTAVTGAAPPLVLGSVGETA